jgi:23S rRNA pseudouridine1911/1915/1917 synthase
VSLSVEPNPDIVVKLRYQDDDVLVVDKPPRLVTQPGKGHETDTLLNGLFAQLGPVLQNLGRSRDFGLLHRLDRQTSGLLIVGLRTRAYDALRAQFEARRIRKFYWAIASHAPKKPSGVIRRPILEETDEKKTGRISSAGKPALTAYRVLNIGTVGARPAALIECRPVTGRLHQVRIHLDSIGCPILGDDLYGPKSVMSASPRLALHAHRVIFEHPVSGATIDVRSPWPKDLNPVLKRMGLTRPQPSADGAHELAGDAVRDQDAGIAERPAVADDAEMP